MAKTKEDQATLGDEGSFELVEHSDALGDQCQDDTTALTCLERKVRELEQRLEEEIEKTKAATALKPVTMVLMWIDVDETGKKLKQNLTAENKQDPRPTAAEAHHQAGEAFQAFWLEISQLKDKKALLRNVTNFSQLQSACLEPFEGESADFVRTADGKLECQNTFFFSVGVHRHEAKEETDTMTRHEIRMGKWKELVALYEHIIIWHLKNDDYTALYKEVPNRLLSRCNKMMFLGRSYVTPHLEKLAKEENDKAQNLTATSEPSLVKPVSSSMQTQQPLPGGSSTLPAKLGISKSTSQGSKSKATANKVDTSSYVDVILDCMANTVIAPLRGHT